MPNLPSADELPRSNSGETALSVCETAARRAGELVMERFRSDVEVSLKGRANVVTDADLASERLILDYVGRGVSGVRNTIRRVGAGGRFVALYVGGGPHRRNPELR